MAAARLAELAGGNRRGTRRFAYETAPKSQTVRDEDGKLLAVRIVDISQRGIGLVLERRLEVGALLNLELPSKSASGPLKLTARVANCRAQPPEGFYVGCLFLRTLADIEFLSVL
jgi:hypothetical protein